MRANTRSTALILATASLVALLAACNADKAGTAADADAAKAGDTAAADKDAVPGLPTEKDRNSYMVGMALGKQFEPMKDEIDVDVVVRALRDTLDGK